MIEVTGKLESQDFVRAQYLHIRPRLSFRIIGVLIVIAIVWAGWFSFFGKGSEETSSSDFLFLAAMCYLLFYFLVFIPWKARQVFKQHKSFQRKVKMRFTETGFNSENELGQVEIPWSDYRKWKEGDHLFLLYMSDPIFHIIPKQFFDNATDIERLRDLLAVKIGPGAA